MKQEDVSIKYWKKKNCTQVAAEMLANVKYPRNVIIWKKLKHKSRIYATDVEEKLKDEVV